MVHPRPGGVTRPLSRRSFLAASGALALTACGGSAPLVSVESTDPAFLQAAFPAGSRQPTILSTGTPQRGVFGLTRGTGFLMADLVPDALDLTLTSPDGETSEVRLPRHADQIPRHYYPLVFEPEQTGAWELAGEFEGEALSVSFMVAEPADVGLVKIGEQMRPVDTPTTADARGVDPICTRAPEACPFHSITLSEALTAGGPVALMISTPGFCQTGICGPTLELLIAEAESHPDITIVHAEVYTDPQELANAAPADLLAPVVETYAMAFEPSLLVADATGAITARLDVTMDATEIRAALATVA